MHASCASRLSVEASGALAARAVWSRSAGAPAATCSRARAPPVRAQALGGPQPDAEEMRRVPRGSAATPVRVYTPVAEAASAAGAATAAEEAAAGGRSLPGLGHAPVSMEQVSEPVAADMAICRQNLLNVVGERHPMLLAAANQIFSAGGKRLRPLIVLLVARATYPLTGLRCMLARGFGRQAGCGCPLLRAAPGAAQHDCCLGSAVQRHHRAAPEVGRDLGDAAHRLAGARRRAGRVRRAARCVATGRACPLWLLAVPSQPPSHPASHSASHPSSQPATQGGILHPREWLGKLLTMAGRPRSCCRLTLAPRLTGALLLWPHSQPQPASHP